MNKKIAIPLENGILCSHFGHCQKFAIIEIQSNTVMSITEITPPEHQPGLYPKWIASFGVTDVIAGGIGEHAIQLFNQNNINVHAGAQLKYAKELAEDFINHKLNLNINSCDH